MSACFDTANIIMKSRMRESRTYGSVRGLHREVQVYSTVEVSMYERMLDKQEKPNIEEMTKFCDENSERFSLLNEWLVSTFNTEKKLFFPMEINMAGE